MSQQMYIEYGAEMLDFQADGYKLLDGFYPNTPAAGAESVTESFEVLIAGDTWAELKAKKNAIELAIEHAKLHKNDTQAAYLYYDVEGNEEAWMSKLLGGEVVFDSKLYNRWHQDRLKVIVVLEHMPYWDAQSERQVPLTNGNGTNNLSGLTVFNHDDGEGTSPNHHDNYVEITEGAIEGEIPGPTRLELLNSYATSKLKTVWIGQNWTDPANLTWILEGESSSTGTEQTAASCSGGKYREYALPTGSEVDMFTWSLSAAFMDACKGEFYKILARFYNGDPANVKFRLKLKYNDVLVWQSGQVTLDQTRAFNIRDLLNLRLPPWLEGQSNLAAMSLILSGQQSTGSPINVDLDFLQVTPLDGWRMLEEAGYAIEQNQRLVDDGFLEQKYVDNGSGSSKVGYVIGYGTPIHLYPGKKQRLYFLMHSSTGDLAEIARTVSVKLYYRPRRKSL